MSIVMTSDVLKRYKQKVDEFCDKFDPYQMKNENDSLPRNVGYFDVYNYCILKDSSYTHQAFKAYKSLEVYKMFENGWVQSIICKNISNGSILLSKVSVVSVEKRKHHQMIRFRLNTRNVLLLSFFSVGLWLTRKELF